jgi:sulfate adenylyltransferase
MHSPIAALSATAEAELDALVATFKEDVATLRAFPIEHVVLASAWLVSDNVIVDLFQRFTDLRPAVAAVDTLHLFPETHTVAGEMQARYTDFKFVITRPDGCSTQAEFDAKYGHWLSLSHADFDKHSKIDPLMRAFEQLGKVVTITGRRADQGNERAVLAVWEAQSKTLNPLANWTFQQVSTLAHTQPSLSSSSSSCGGLNFCVLILSALFQVANYVLKYNIPYNPLHRVVLTSQVPVLAKNRDSNPDLVPVQLEKPYFAYTDEEVLAHGRNVYVWKSFGDTHTSVPVMIHESERAGRFVGRNQTECGIHTRMSPRGAPHGGRLIDLLITDEAKIHELEGLAAHRLFLNERQTCDLELLANGGFSPLRGFMTQVEYDSVVKDMRLPEGQLFGLPVTLDTDDVDVKVGDYVLLIDETSGARGVIHVASKWVPDRRIEARLVYGTNNEEHPSVYHIMQEKKRFNIGGPLTVFRLPTRDWVTCRTPAQLRAEFNGRSVIAFQSRNPLHRAHVALLLRVAKQNDALVLVHPVVGPTKDDDVPAKVRKETYDALAERLKGQVQFDYLPYSMMVGGPREALQHIIIRKNYGCTGMIVGRDHAGCKDKSGKDFYGPYDAQTLLRGLTKELAMDMHDFLMMGYVSELNEYLPEDEAKEKGYTVKNISGTKFRQMLISGEEVPEWFAFPDVITVLRKWAREQQTAVSQ